MTILAIVHLSVNRLDLVFRWSLGQEASLLNKNLGPKNFTSRPRLSCWLSASSLDWKRNPLPHYDTPTSSCTHRHMHTHKRTHAHTHTHTPHPYCPLHSILMPEKQGTFRTREKYSSGCLIWAALYLYYPSPEA